jgi:hypothetical protein
MEWVANTLSRNVVYPAILPLMRTPRLPVVDSTDARADLNGLVRFAERRNLVSARVPSHFKRSLPDLLVAVGEMSYGIRVGLIGSTRSLHYLCIYLFVFVI